jgi:very-short-patch-repair endonuclease
MPSGFFGSIFVYGKSTAIDSVGKDPRGHIFWILYASKKKIAVEVDGGQHGEQEIHDRRRDDWLREQGFIVLRFWNHEVLTQIDAVKEVIVSSTSIDRP